MTRKQYRGRTAQRGAQTVEAPCGAAAGRTSAERAYKPAEGESAGCPAAMGRKGGPGPEFGWHHEAELLSSQSVGREHFLARI